METTTTDPLVRKAPSEVGLRLRSILRERSMSLAALHRASGVSTSQLSLLTNGGIAYPRIKTVQQICTALKLPPSALLAADVPSNGHPTIPEPVVVPVVRLDMAPDPIATGMTTTIDSSIANGRSLLACEIVDGIAPYVMYGDLVIFDHKADPAHGDCVIIAHGTSHAAAVALVTGGMTVYCLGDGTWLDSEKVAYGGVLVRIERPAPPASALLRLTGG